MKADLLLGMRFLAETTYSLTELLLTIELNGTLIQAFRTSDSASAYQSRACLQVLQA